MYKIVGVLEKSFTFDNNGQKHNVHGYKVFCTDDSRPKVDGLATLDFFMSDAVCNRSDYKPKVGDRLDYLCYNRFGKLDSVLLYVE